MCGIAGAVWNSPQKAIDQTVLERMTDVLRHRGPDDRGTLLNDYLVRPPYPSVPGVALGHRRLSIIDLACGHQPLGNEDGSVVVVHRRHAVLIHQRGQASRPGGAGHSTTASSKTGRGRSSSGIAGVPRKMKPAIRSPAVPNAASTRGE